MNKFTLGDVITGIRDRKIVNYEWSMLPPVARIILRYYAVGDNRTFFEEVDHGPKGDGFVNSCNHALAWIAANRLDADCTDGPEVVEAIIKLRESK